MLFIFSCKKENHNTTKTTDQPKSSIKYAKGFDIIKTGDKKKLIIKTAYQNSNDVFEYLIVDKSSLKTKEIAGNVINTPVKKIVVTSTTHIPMVELLDEENSIVGFPFTRYISSKKTRKLIENDSIKEIGKENNLNTEILLDLNPELIVGYSVSSADKSLSNLKKSGINVIYNGDWLEETPLGRAEWIKFFGILFNKEKQADSIFNVIENNYLKTARIAKNSKIKPTILSGAVMNKDIWNLPAGDSFVAKFLEDANLNYLWANTKGKGSLSLSFESVFDKGLSADYWITPGYFNDKEQMLNSNNLYAKFYSFKNDKIYSPTIKKGKTGGVLYYEIAPTRPDLVLKDILKITKPDLLPNYELTFFEKMN